MTRSGIFAIFSVLSVAPLVPVAAQDMIWVRQAGTPEDDYGSNVALDTKGNAYIAGFSQGSLGGSSAGSYDAVLAKYDASGAVLWTRQLGTSLSDAAPGIAVSSAGDVFITGYTQGSIGETNAGNNDIFLAKYDSSGSLLWTRQIGTSLADSSFGVAVDSAGDAYITGFTSGNLGGTNAGGADVFLAKFDASGVLLWTRQTGSAAADVAYAVSVDSWSNVYITGRTEGSLAGTNAGGADAFLAKYDTSGVLLWTRQIGTSSSDESWDVSVDGAGNAYIAGSTLGNLDGTNAGGTDAFLAKFDALGVLLWTRQIGTTGGDLAYGVAADGAGNAYITGYSLGSLGGQNAGGYDAVLAKYDAVGTLLWTRQFGTTVDDYGRDLSLDIAGNAFIVGSTFGSLGGPYLGVRDIFLAKYGPSPCPSDFNQDGFVNGDDFDAFVLVFEAGNVGADFDGNGFVNGDDFDGYVAAFEVGC